MLHTERTSEKVKPGLRDYWQIFLRRKWLIILPIITIVSIAIPGSFLMTPVYQASTTLISQEVERGSILQGVANIPVPRGEAMNTVRQKIESRTNIKEVAGQVGLAEHLRGAGSPSTIDDVIRYFRQIVTLRARGSKIIEISVVHQNPNMAKNIADTIANTYVNITKKWRQDTTIASTSFIDQELEIWRQQLLETEEALLAAQEKGVLDSLSASDSTLVGELVKLKTDLAEVDLDLQGANSELRSARSIQAGNVTGSRSSAFYADPETTRLQADLAGLQAQYKELSAVYTDEYHEIRRLKGEIVRKKEELDNAKARSSTQQQDVASRVQYWEDKIRELNVKRTWLNDKISEYDRKLRQLPQRQLELSRLQRDKAAAESTYSMLLARKNEAQLLQSSEMQDMGRIARVLDLAMLPDRPASPNKKKIAVLALAMGMVIGFGSAFLLEYFDRSLRSVDEVTDYLGIPVLAAVPMLTTFESELKERRRRWLRIVCMISVSLLALCLIADIVSAEFLARDSVFLPIARIGLNVLRGLM